MTAGLTVLQTALETELPLPPWGFGLIAFGILVTLLLITLAAGKGRPHS